MGRRLVKFNTETFRGDFDVLPNAKEEDGSFAVVTDRNNDVYLSSNNQWVRVNNSGFSRMTFAELLTNYPAVNNEGFIAVLTDVNNIAVQSDGSRYKPLNNSAIVSSLGAEITTSGTTEAILHQAFFPAGLLKAGDTIRYQLSISKSGASETSDYSLRFGTAGTTSDTQLQTFQWLGASSRTNGIIAEWKVLSATQFKRIGSGAQSTPFAGASTATTPDATTVSNMDSNDMYLSAGALMSSTVEVLTMHAMAFEWISS